AQALQGGGHRCAEQFGQTYQLRLRADRAPAEEQAGPARLDQLPGGFAYGVLVPLGSDVDRHELRHLVHVTEKIADVVGQLDEYRARLAASGDPVGVVEGGNDFVVRGNAERGLGDG